MINVYFLKTSLFVEGRVIQRNLIKYLMLTTTTTPLNLNHLCRHTDAISDFLDFLRKYIIVSFAYQKSKVFH